MAGETWPGRLALLHTSLILFRGLAQACPSHGDAESLRKQVETFRVSWHRPGTEELLFLLYSVDRSHVAESRVSVGEDYQVTWQKVRIQEGRGPGPLIYQLLYPHFTSTEAKA